MKARKSDPFTSFEAAGSVTNLGATKTAILALLATQALTDEQIVLAYRKMADLQIAPYASESGIRSRRNELVQAGLVEAVDVGKSYSGRKALIWGVVNG